MQFTIKVLAFAGFSFAQSTISLFIPDADAQPFIASVIGSDTTATTYFIQCGWGVDDNVCDFPGGLVLTEGPSTAAYTFSLGSQDGSTSVLDFTGYIDCTLTGLPATSGVCSSSFSGPSAQQPGMSTSTLALIDITYLPVTLSDFALSTTILSPTVTVTTIDSASPASTAMTISTSSDATGATIPHAIKTTSSSKAGAAQAMVTGKVPWVVGGAAVAWGML